MPSCWIQNNKTGGQSYRDTTPGELFRWRGVTALPDNSPIQQKEKQVFHFILKQHRLLLFVYFSKCFTKQIVYHKNNYYDKKINNYLMQKVNNSLVTSKCKQLIN